MKRALKFLANRAGYSICKKKPPVYRGEYFSAYLNAMAALLSCLETIRIVEVGANDGAIKDPIYEFVKQFSDRTTILLIEPQTHLVPYLRKNYEFHPAHEIFNGAIGPDDNVTLYSVKPEFWRKIDAPYARSWPIYRAPTGVTSLDQEHVRRWLARHLRSSHSIDDAIAKNLVKSTTLPMLLKKAGWPRTIDVLQVDAEGFDDQVIYNCMIETTLPRIIYFEAKALTNKAGAALHAYLTNRGYLISLHDDDALAVLTRRQSLR